MDLKLTSCVFFVIVACLVGQLETIRLPIRRIPETKWEKFDWNKHGGESLNRDPIEIVAIEGDWGEDERNHWDLEFTAFDRPHKLRMQPNSHLTSSPHLQIVKKSQFSSEKIAPKRQRNCHWIGNEGRGSIAGISNCNEQKKISGLLVLDDLILEIEPLPESLQQAVLSESGERFDQNLHIVKRSTTLPDIRNDYRKGPVPLRTHNLTRMEFRSGGERKLTNDRLTLEVALFFDQAGYEIFAPFFRYDSEKISDLLLAYLNGVQALYYHPSLGEPIDIVLTYMEIMRQQPDDLPTYDGERSDLLDSFCSYQRARNKRDGEDGHWDMALYVSGLDFFAWENGQKSSATMGLATVGGVCLADYNCITAEFGVTNIFGRPFPSAGFTSVYILAHEIGHNLGMSHDSTGNECPKDGFIMSPSRGTQGETIWSTCSAEVIKDIRNWAYCLEDKPKGIKEEYDAMGRFNGHPGQIYTAKKQCEILLLDEDAIPSPYDGLDKICQNLPCTTTHRMGYYFAGPALEGTVCGDEKWCVGGECLKKSEIDQQNDPPPISGDWSEWSEGDCSTGCILRSKGFTIRHRTCTNPSPINSEEECDGLSFDISLCDDQRICAHNRYLTANNYATLRCNEFRQLIPELDDTPEGIQALYEKDRLWVSCAIFCRRKDVAIFYSPRLDLNDLGKMHDAYFPDGTFCHNDGNQNYYCLHHHCLPENFKFSKITDLGAFFNDDIPFWLGNASPEEETGQVNLNEMLFEYMSLDGKGQKPLRTRLDDGAKSWRTSPKDWTVDNDDGLRIHKNELDGFYFE